MSVAIAERALGQLRLQCEGTSSDVVLPRHQTGRDFNMCLVRSSHLNGVWLESFFGFYEYGCFTLYHLYGGCRYAQPNVDLFYNPAAGDE